MRRQFLWIIIMIMSFNNLQRITYILAIRITLKPVPTQQIHNRIAFKNQSHNNVLLLFAVPSNDDYSIYVGRWTECNPLGAGEHAARTIERYPHKHTATHSAFTFYLWEPAIKQKRIFKVVFFCWCSYVFGVRNRIIEGPVFVHLSVCHQAVPW